MLEESPAGNWRVIWPLALAATIVFVSGRSIPREFASVMEHEDKVVHFLAFGLLATLVVRLRFVQRGRLVGALIAIAVTSLFGWSDEWHQSFTPGRRCDLWDWTTDTLGAVVAVWCYLGWTGYRRVLEWRLWPRREKLRVEMFSAAVPNPAE